MTLVTFTLPLVIPLAVLTGFALFARLIKRRRREGRNYEFHHPLSGAYGGGREGGATIAQPHPQQSAGSSYNTTSGG